MGTPKKPGTLIESCKISGIFPDGSPPHLWLSVEGIQKKDTWTPGDGEPPSGVFKVPYHSCGVYSTDWVFPYFHLMFVAGSGGGLAMNVDVRSDTGVRCFWNDWDLPGCSGLGYDESYPSVFFGGHGSWWTEEPSALVCSYSQAAEKLVVNYDADTYADPTGDGSKGDGTKFCRLSDATNVKIYQNREES